MNFTSIIIIFLASVSMARAAMSPVIYTDNGYTTQFEHFTSESEKGSFERELATILGLPHRSKESVSVFSRKTSASKHIIDVYKYLEDKKNELSSKENNAVDDGYNFTSTEMSNIGRSDLITSIVSRQECDIDRNSAGQYTHLWFNLPRLSTAHVIAAELRIFQNSNNTRQTALYKLNVHEVVDTKYGEASNLVKSIILSDNKYGWIDVNVKSSVISWMTFPTTKNGLYLEISPLFNNNSEMRRDPEDIGFVIYGTEPQTLPFLVLYLKATNQVTQHKNAIFLRSQKHSLAKSTMLYPLISPPMYRGSCALHSVRLSFKELHWDHFVLEPDSYTVHYCAGVCQHPFDYEKTSNHAWMQLLLHLQTDGKVPKPACAPIQFAPLPVLYMDKQGHTTLKHFKNMDVSSCGCI